MKTTTVTLGSAAAALLLAVGLLIQQTSRNERIAHQPPSGAGRPVRQKAWRPTNAPLWRANSDRHPDRNALPAISDFSNPTTSTQEPDTHVPRASRAEVPPAEIPARRLLALPPDPTRTVDSEYAEYLTILQSSGSTSEAWTSKARNVLMSLTELQASVQDIRCFQAACVADIVFTNEQQADNTVEDALHLLSKWHGNHILTGERPRDTSIVRTAILVRPLTPGI